MKTIWKFSVIATPGSSEFIEMPAGARIIHAADQDGTPSIWAEVDPDAPKEQRLFSVIGTGWHGYMQDGWQHLGTFFQAGYVWHIYELPGRPT